VKPENTKAADPLTKQQVLRTRAMLNNLLDQPSKTEIAESMMMPEKAMKKRGLRLRELESLRYNGRLYAIALGQGLPLVYKRLLEEDVSSLRLKKKHPPVNLLFIPAIFSCLLRGDRIDTGKINPTDTLFLPQP